MVADTITAPTTRPPRRRRSRRARREALRGWAYAAPTAIFVIFVFPLWALAVLGVNLLVIWALTAHSEDFDATYS